MIKRIGEITGPGRLLRGRCRPAPDVGRAFPALGEAGPLAQLRGPGHDGLLRARRDGGQGGSARTPSSGASTATAASDDQPGTRHVRVGGHSRQDRGDQQPKPGHGPAVADPVLRQPLLQHRPSNTWWCPVT